RKSADYQAYLSRRASGWLQKVFRSTPEWMHLPFLLVYGILRPMLPAALLAGGTPLWRAIAIWRSLGWTLLLSLLVYALVRLIQRQNWRAMPGAMFLVAWSANLIASYRGGGDLWDNPRYRAMFTGLQVSLAAWAWVDHTKHPGPWLRRVLIGVGLVIAWLTPWYLQRYYPSFEWPIVDLFKTIALGLASAVLFLIWDWARSQR
ncbi:MAG TPA: hypothetical protein VLY63_07405, partial [Anaerolineae bacterium]|nr:hypothetical protein [Anaerolineae bacterium]